MNIQYMFLISQLLFSAPLHNWKFIDNKFWQIIDDSIVIEPKQDISNGKCPLGMVYVNGEMADDLNPNPFGTGTVEYLQKTTCARWITQKFPERCQTFDREKWLWILQALPKKHMEFCIDSMEYPSQKGAYPWIFIDWNDSNKVCQAENKRLCSEEEQTFACEGLEAKPYPYGYERSSIACNIDKPWIAYNSLGFKPRERAYLELDRLWQGEPNGHRPKCVSDFGVYDLTGNLDEWTTKTRTYGKYKSILRSGYWSGVRNRCRPTTRNHSENMAFYQIGFRCCG